MKALEPLKARAGLGERIRSARRRAGLTQSQLAKGIVSTGYVSRVEHGDRFPSRAVVERFAHRLGLEVGDLDVDGLDQQHAAARLRLCEGRIRLALGEVGRARFVNDELSRMSTRSAPLEWPQAVSLHDAEVCLVEGNLVRAHLLLDSLSRLAAGVPGLEAMTSACRCDLALGSIGRASEIARRLVELTVANSWQALPEGTFALYWASRTFTAAAQWDSAKNAVDLARQITPSTPSPELVAALFAACGSAETASRFDLAALLAERALFSLNLIRQQQLLADFGAWCRDS